MIINIRMLLIMATAAAIFYYPSLLFAGAQGQEKGALFLSLQPYYYSTDQYFDEHGRLHDRGGTFTKFEVNPYLEYGLTDNETLTINIFYNWLTDDVSGRERQTQGLTDQEIGLQHRIATGVNGTIAIHGLMIIPTGYVLEDDPRLGYDCLGAEMSLLYGQSFQMFHKYGFVDLRLGYRDYFGYPSSQLRINTVLGYDISPGWQIFALGELQYGLKNGHEKQLSLGSSVQPDYRLLKVTIAARVHISKHYSLVAGGYKHVWGEETGGGGGGYVSLWYSN